MLGTLLRQEGADPKVLEMLYRAVALAVLIFGSETWVLSAEMDRKVEGTHTGFLKNIMRKRARRIADETWEMPGVEVVRETVGTQSTMTYIGRQQETVAQWVTLRPIFEVCAGDKVYEGVGRSM